MNRVCKIIILALICSSVNLLSEENFSDFTFAELALRISENSNWELAEEINFLSRKKISDSGDPFFEALIEFGMVEGIAGKILLPEDTTEISASIYQMPSQRNAYGLYSFEKSPSLKYYDIAFETYLLGQRFISWYGEFILIFEFSEPSLFNEDFLKDFSSNIIELLPEQKQNTPILDALPDKNRVKHSEKFHSQRWLEQDYFSNIYYADYYIPSGYSRIFIIDNITTARADSNFWRFLNFIKENAKVVAEELEMDTDYYIVDEPIWGKSVLSKKNQIIFGILDFSNEEWTSDRLEELLNRLKKAKVVKTG